MPNPETAELQSWLELLCRMLPGINQALLLTDSSSESDSNIHWPVTGEISGDVLAAASLASNQNKTVTTTLTTDQRNDTAVEMIIALPLSRIENFTGTLAILVKIKPSQQSVVMQILHWGEDWLGLLLRHKEFSASVTVSPVTDHSDAPVQKSRSRLVGLGALLLVGFLIFMSGTYRVTASAHLEGKIQRAVIAPFDGYISAAYARAGEYVKEGEIIAELDTEELLLQKQRYEAEQNEYTRQYRKALAVRDQPQAQIFKSQVNQASAQLSLLESKLQRSTLVSTLDGVIISGDLSRSMGVPVKTGDVLFEVSPLNEYRLVILVDEKQVVDVKKGLRGVLTLKSLPNDELPFIVHKVSPVFEEKANGIAYRVEARLVENYAALRPGMQGIAKIDIDQRSYWWIYLHDLFDLIRLWAWRWLP